MKQEMWQTLYPEVEIPDKNYIQGIHHTAVAGSLPDAVTAVYILERTALVNIWTLLKAMRPHGLRREMRMLAEIADDEKRHVQTGFETLKAIGAPPTSEILYIGAILDVWGRVAPALPAAIAGAAQVEIPTDMNSRLAADLVEKLR
jgi:hypothetical protein